MAKYAQGTTVSMEASRMEIERTIMRYGASKYMSATDNEAGQAMIGFFMRNRQLRFIVPMPRYEDFSLTETGRKRTENSQREAWEQSCRQRWRALALVIKAKLEAVESGISEFDDEFMANIVLPDGSTVGKFMKPQIDAAYSSGVMPQLLPMMR